VYLDEISVGVNIEVGIVELIYHILQSTKVCFTSLQELHENKAEERGREPQKTNEM